MLYVGRNDDDRGNSRLAARVATWSKGANGFHSVTAAPVSSIPRRPARPVSCVNCPGLRNSWRSPLNLLRRSMTTARAGMLMPTASVSVANTALSRPRLKHSSTVSRNAGIMPAWWAATPASRVASQRS